MRYVNDIIIHCTATPPGMAVTMDQLRQWHRERGWKTVGYHYVVLLDGSVAKGRPASQPGAHCYGHNAHSIGVAYVGGLDAHGRPLDTRTPEQKAALLKLLTNLTLFYRCQIHGHHDYNKGKACPCFDAAQEYAGLYRQLVLNR
mgnify:CR=1 FL=1